MTRREIEIIEARIKKCERRIAAGYVTPDGQESEQSRLERLRAVLRGDKND